MTRLICGDCLDVLSGIEAESIHACVTDPPYGMTQRSATTYKSAFPGRYDEAHCRGGFMGMKWDGSGVELDPATWAAVYRVLKPGAYLLAFGGTRTVHRIACAIEDAGFEIRDQIAWMFGSGFPKSLDVGKAMDKRRASNDVIRPWLRSLGARAEIAAAAGVTPRQVDHWLGDNTPCPQTLTEDRFIRLCEHFGTVPEWADEMYSVIGERLGTIQHSRSGGEDFAKVVGSSAAPRVVDVNAPATDLAKQWDGWGTALKPAYEPIIVARKPFKGTVAANVAAHGTGAINVDACRIEGAPPSVPQPSFNSPTGRVYGFQTGEGRNGEMSQASGRWPANVVLDQLAGAVLDAQSGESSDKARKSKGIAPAGNGFTHGAMQEIEHRRGFADSGGASRFFYCPKSDKAERTIGGAPSIHPTVKPIALMQWLVRLVTPPGGTVLDPFMGSGSTGIACSREGFDFIGIELSAEYLDIARRRIHGDAPLFSDIA